MRVSRQTIFVRLLDVGVECWRPVEAVVVGPGVYGIVSPRPDPEDEKWEFGSGQDVACERRMLDGDRCHLVAVRAESSAG